MKRARCFDRANRMHSNLLGLSASGQIITVRAVLGSRNSYTKRYAFASNLDRGLNLIRLTRAHDTGWNLSVLYVAIESAIRSAGYLGRVTIKFEAHANRVMVRPDSRALSNIRLKILLTITFVYPLIWLYQHVSSKGGGRWTIAGRMYALNWWILPRTTYSPTHCIIIFQPPDGPGMLVLVQGIE
ncbi:hypothetical protein BJV78DRAFT_396596 [Lactifluus subvellereus]|nr:hypothetical protein BJV78DRAFT_396596 [Lactifluus subvellereus]